MNSHTDPDLVQISQETIAALRKFYGRRLGIVYILHVNIVFWWIYLLLTPFLRLLRLHKRFVVVREAKGDASSLTFYRPDFTYWQTFVSTSRRLTWRRRGNENLTIVFGMLIRVRRVFEYPNGSDRAKFSPMAVR